MPKTIMADDDKVAVIHDRDTHNSNYLHPSETLEFVTSNLALSESQPQHIENSSGKNGGCIDVESTIHRRSLAVPSRTKGFDSALRRYLSIRPVSKAHVTSVG